MYGIESRYIECMRAPKAVLCYRLVTCLLDSLYFLPFDNDYFVYVDVCV